MKSLTIQHLQDSDPARFYVVRGGDTKSLGPVEVPNPAGFPVTGRPHSDLLAELRWYLEKFLEYPFHPDTDHAERVLDALKDWGTRAFQSLFDNRIVGGWFDSATQAKYADLRLQVASDDPAVLAWPWEALRDPAGNKMLAHACLIERHLNRVRDPHAVSEQLPRDRVHILLVTARPYAADVRYRSISRPLVELIARSQVPATVTVLRPPTFDRLREHLRERPNHYHILHFDGHGGYGGYGAVAEPSDPHTYQGLLGQLVFEDERGKPDPKDAETLGTLLQDTQVPVVVLNACRSGMVDRRAEDAFASVAAGLLSVGVRSVVAMAYSLYVSGAQQFLPAFYGRLFENGDVADATRAGRQQMLSQRERICVRGRHPLDDWLVPVLYSQDALQLSFAPQAPVAESAAGPRLPVQADDAENPYGFIGRDSALLALERALRRPPAGLLVHGLGGVGKTTLARGLIHWLATTGGLTAGCFWFSSKRSATPNSCSTRWWASCSAPTPWPPIGSRSWPL